MSGLKEYGKYTVTAVVEGETVTGTFELRPQKSGKDILQFSIDGNKGKIKGNSIDVTLPKGSTIFGRIPVFTISEGAVLLNGDTVIESGKTSLDFKGTVTLTVRAEDGTSADYAIRVTLSSGSSSGGSGGGGGNGGVSNKVIMPNVTPKPDVKDDTSDAEKGFSDVSSNHWAYEYVEKLRKDGIVNGVGENCFYPENTVKREEFAKMLVLSMGLNPEGKSGFADAEENWSDSYLAAAKNAGIINGIADGMFGVGHDITRQDLAIMIYRALPETLKSSQSGELFADDDAIADYAKEAVYALRSLGLISGYENQFRPDERATRAESAKILAGFKGMIEK